VQSERSQIVLTFASNAGKSERPASRHAQTAAAKSSAEATAIAPDDDGRKAEKCASTPPISFLHQLLTVFVSRNGQEWRAYDGLSGVTWRDAFPMLCPDVVALDSSYSRAGVMLLLGFSEIELPDTGAEKGSGVRQGNEGESSLSLNGDSGAVHEIAIVKYYPDEDVGGVLRRQLPETVDVTLIGSDDLSVEVAGAWLYRIRFPDGGQAYADIVNEEGGRSGPGFTTFVLTRNDPRKRTPDMRCREE
jgi:hypothetical protein